MIILKKVRSRNERVSESPWSIFGAHYPRNLVNFRRAATQAIVKRLENDVAADKSVIIGFRIADIYPEMFTFEKGDRKGQPGVSIKGRLLRIKFAKVNGEPIDVPQPARSEERESVPF